MKKLILILFILLCISISGYGQQKNTSDNQSVKDPIKEKLIDSVKKAAPRFVNDVSANTISQAQIFNEVAPTGFDLFNANISFADKDQVQKIGFSPLRLSQKYYGVLSNLRLNVSNKSGQLTSGLSIGYDNTAFQSKRVEGLMKNFTSQVENLPELPEKGANESIEDFKKRTADYNKQLNALASTFEDRRLRNIIKATLGYNAQFFSVLKSKSFSNSFDSLNYHAFKGHNLFLSGSYSYNNGWITVEAGINYFYKRKAADSIQTQNPYLGYSVGVTKRIIRLISKKQLLTKDYYQATRFIPSIYLGLGFEQSDYNGSDYRFAEENTKSWYTFTPFFDVSISPTVQFRMAFPIKNVKDYTKGTDGQNIGTILSFNYKLIGL